MDYDYFFHPYDFKPSKNYCEKLFKIIEVIPAKPCHNKEICNFGAKVFRGATTMIAVSYWLIKVLCPKKIIYLGCDMNYKPNSNGNTHFYGKGSPDPLRKHISLKNLDAKLKRLWYFAQLNKVELYCYPNKSFSRLPYPQLNRDSYNYKFNFLEINKAKQIEKSILNEVCDNNFKRIENTKELVKKLELIDIHWQNSIKANEY